MPMEDGLPEFRTLPADSEVRVNKPSRAPWVVMLVVAIGAGAAVAWLWQRGQGQESALNAANAHANDLQHRVDELAAANADLTGKLSKLEAEKNALTQARDELQRDVAAKSDELAKLQGTYDQLADKMKAEIAKGDIQLTQVGGRVQVDLVDKILFDSGDAQISKRGEEVLQRVGAVLASIDDKQIQVSGHTDDSPISSRLTGQFPTNWELSSARATNVVRFLSEKANVPGKRLVASGYGQFHPISNNANPTGRARNRRIEILLTPLLETVPTKVAVAKGAPASKPAGGTVKQASTTASKGKPAVAAKASGRHR